MLPLSRLLVFSSTTHGNINALILVFYPKYYSTLLRNKSPSTQKSMQQLYNIRVIYLKQWEEVKRMILMKCCCSWNLEYFKKFSVGILKDNKNGFHSWLFHYVKMFNRTIFNYSFPDYLQLMWLKIYFN